MTKVFLVEDEIVIRSGIKNSIDWQKEGYEFSGEASDGELAYPMILKAKPDILITDIKMPFMDGLELSKMVKEALPEIKILILSGYNEFEYAKEAIHIGVADYLLKPISSAKLLEALGGIAKQIKQKREEQSLKEQYQRDNQEYIENEKVKLFTALAAGNISMGDAVNEAKALGMDLSAQVYNVMLFKVSMRLNDYQSPEQAMDVFGEIEDVNHAVPGTFFFRRGVEGWAFLVTAETEDNGREKMGHLKKYLFSVMEKYLEIEYFGGIGEPVRRIRELGSSYEKAGIVFSTRFVNDSRQILDLNDIRILHEKSTINVQSLDLMDRNRTLMDKFLVKGNLEEVESFITAYFEEMPKENLESSLMRQYITMDMYIVAGAFCDRLGIPKEERTKDAEELENALRMMTTAQGVHKYVRQLLKNTIERRDIVSGSRYSDIIETAKDYIAKSYMSDEVSLNTVAAAVNMSPSYFSSVFSREVGKTFVEYLTTVRMDKAKELLMCSPLKTSEIGYEVGYKDPHYFSYIFKKTQNCSPKDYRQRGKRG
ncbi:response regulator [Faecalicatena contorta]|uniref:Stage 0 sporulation protein A homolog n=1 Tax=Faecalicatena contorta TaxID=39482 RepID=A0A315ZQY8_9FIRM|nr:response regulator [Faecalicatena contorta]PWJ47946.1 two-component system response regulator YesN [Faecalicatena contorta]SUQ15709.1 two-component system, response regulator YesN [Faecalicatena contorta]